MITKTIYIKNIKLLDGDDYPYLMLTSSICGTVIRSDMMSYLYFVTNSLLPRNIFSIFSNDVLNIT